MIIIFNLIGAGILILAFGVGVAVTLLLGAKSEAPIMLVAGLVALVVDLMYRTKRGEGSLLHPRRGGHVFFIPAWGIGLGFFMMGCLDLVLPQNGRELTREYRQGLLLQAPQPRSSLVGSVPTGPVQPEPAALKLTMITAPGQRGLATINGQLFAPGETHSVKVAETEVLLTCVEIREQSVLAKVTGESRPLVLRFGESVPLEATR